VPSGYTQVTNTSSYTVGDYELATGLTGGNQAVKVYAVNNNGAINGFEIVNTASGNILPATTALSIASGGTLDLSGGSQQVVSLSDKTPGNGGSIINSNSAASVLTISPSGGSTTFSGMVQGGGGAPPGSGTISLVINGTGTQVLAGSNTYSGGTTVSAGTLQLGDGTANNGYVQGNILDNAVVAFANPAAQTYSNVISGNGSLTKSGAGTLTLTGSNTYSGGTTVSAGTLQLGDGAANNGYVQGNILDNAAVAFANPAAQTYSNVISGAGSLTKSAAGTLTLSGSNTYSGGTTVSAGTLQLGDGSANNGYVQGNILDNAAVAFANPAAQTYSGVIGGNGSLAKSGSGTLTLTGSNTYSGGTTISGGVLQLGDGVSQNGYIAGIIADNAALNFADPSVQAFAGTISGIGSLTKSGAGTLTLTGSNTFTGGTTVGGGTLTLGNTAALLESTLDTSGAGLLSFGSLTAATLGGLQGSGNLTLGNTAGAGVSLTVGNNSASTTFNGSLSGSGSLIEAGSGTLTLTASNRYSGGTSIGGGVLAAENASAIPGGSLLSIGANGSAVLGTPGATEPLGVLSGGAGPLGSQPSTSGMATAIPALGGSANATPEPDTLALLAAAAACGLAALWRKKGIAD
jgi:autotransporter-associated beta strand protein